MTCDDVRFFSSSFSISFFTHVHGLVLGFVISIHLRVLAAVAVYVSCGGMIVHLLWLAPSLLPLAHSVVVLLFLARSRLCLIG